jgi:hypothetical protein
MRVEIRPSDKCDGCRIVEEIDVVATDIDGEIQVFELVVEFEYDTDTKLLTIYSLQDSGCEDYARLEDVTDMQSLKRNLRRVLSVSELVDIEQIREVKDMPVTFY